MIKPLIILFNTVSVFLFSFFFGDTPVTLKGDFPKNAAAGSEFTASIVINKGKVVGFAKLQFVVPEGFTVKESESKSGNFSFENNIAKIIWTSIPGDAEFTVKFNIMAGASVSGVKTITSKFSYVANNNKEVVEMAPASIMIENASGTATPLVSNETSQTPATETKPETPPSTTTPVTTNDNSSEPASSVVVSRVITNGIKPGELKVEVKINKSNIAGFAKFQDIIPSGYNAVGDATNGSSFSFSEGKAKFVWVVLPPDVVVISYFLEKTASAVAGAILSKGEFSYLENGQSKKVTLPVDPLPDLAGSVASNKLPETNQVNEENTNSTGVTSGGNNTQTQTNTSVSTREGNVSYLVQIGAFINPIQSTVLSRKFNIRESIKSEFAEGYSKFMVGNFGEYKDARTHREEIKQKGCKSAFVVAYNGPKRITVQEALMITNQKWFK